MGPPDGGGPLLYACATALAECLCKNYSVDEKQKGIYIYGFQLFLSSSAVMVSIFILSCLLKSISTSFIFSLIFVSIRLFSGGYHAKTYGRCFLLSNSVYLLCFFSARSIQEHQLSFLCPILTILSFTVIFCLTPITHRNHPLSTETLQKNKLISRVLVLGGSLCVLATYPFSRDSLFVRMASVTLTAAAVMMIVPKFWKGGE